LKTRFNPHLEFSWPGQWKEVVVQAEKEANKSKEDE
jgi:hypothetical protein